MHEGRHGSRGTGRQARKEEMWEQAGGRRRKAVWQKQRQGGNKGKEKQAGVAWGRHRQHIGNAKAEGRKRDNSTVSNGKAGSRKAKVVV